MKWPIYPLSVLQQNTSMEEPKSLGLINWERLCFSFPHLAEKIFGKSNNQNLVKIKEVCKAWNDFVKKSKFYNCRIIKSYTNCSDELMKDMAKNTKDAMEIASNLDMIFKRFSKGTRQSSNYLKNWDDTPLHAAADNGDLKSYHLIMENVTDKNPSNHHYKYPMKEGMSRKTTPLHLAARNGDFNLFKLIFNNVDDKNPRDTFRNTPFHLAAENGHLSICQLIIARLEDKNPSGGDCNGFGFGWTPLHIAAKNGHLDVCKLITEALRKAEKNVNPIFLPLRLTPLDLAIQYEHIHVQEHLQNLQQALQPDLGAK